jgi:hypothetical protein
MNLKECCDASVAAFGFVYNAIEGDKQFPEHLSIEAYISCHTEAMKLYMTSIINEAKGKSFNKPQYEKPKDQPQHEHRTGSDSGGGNPCTEKQAKAVFVITHDKVNNKWERNKLFIELETYGIINKDDIKNMPYDAASDFIEKFGN